MTTDVRFVRESRYLPAAGANPSLVPSSSSEIKTSLSAPPVALNKNVVAFSRKRNMMQPLASDNLKIRRKIGNKFQTQIWYFDSGKGKINWCWCYKTELTTNNTNLELSSSSFSLIEPFIDVSECGESGGCSEAAMASPSGVFLKLAIPPPIQLVIWFFTFPSISNRLVLVGLQ